MSFLNKANEDVSGGSGGAATSSAGHSKFKAQDTGAEIPQAIRSATKDSFYVSDADEPFEGVSLKWNGEGGLPDEGLRFLPLLHSTHLPLYIPPLLKRLVFHFK